MTSAASSSVHRPIADEQNTDESLELLRACTSYYLRAKRWHALKIAGTLVLALLVPVVTFRYPDAGDALGALAGFWVLVGRTLIDWLTERQVRQACTIQEQREVQLFDLPWNTSVAGKRTAPEDIDTAERKVNDPKTLERLRDWFPVKVDRAPWPLNVLLCQRSSAVWGRRSHLWYAAFVLSLGIGWFVAGIVMGVIAHVSLGGYLVKIFLPSQPAFLDTIDLVRGHHRMSGFKEALEHQIDELFARGSTDLAAVSGADTREVQDQAYRLRMSGLQVPQLFYRARRGTDERAMVAAVDRLLKGVPGGQVSQVAPEPQSGSER